MIERVLRLRDEAPILQPFIYMDFIGTLNRTRGLSGFAQRGQQFHVRRMRKKIERLDVIDYKALL